MTITPSSSSTDQSSIPDAANGQGNPSAGSPAAGSSAVPAGAQTSPAAAGAGNAHIDKLRIDVTGITEDDARLLANLVAQGLVPALDATPGYASMETLKVNVTAPGDLGSQPGVGGTARGGGTASGGAGGGASGSAGSSTASGSGIRVLAAQIVDQISVAVSGRVAGTLGEGIPS